MPGSVASGTPYISNMPYLAQCCRGSRRVGWNSFQK